MQYGAQAPPSGLLERMTPPTAQAFYLFWLMQFTQGEVDPCFLNGIICTSVDMVQRATLNALELETLLNVRVMTARFAHLLSLHRLHPVHGAVLRSLDHADRLLVRRTPAKRIAHRDQGLGGIALLTAKNEAHRSRRSSR